MRKLIGTILITLPFILLFLIFLLGGLFGLFLYILYLFVAFSSTMSFIIGLWCLKGPKFSWQYKGKIK